MAAELYLVAIVVRDILRPGTTRCAADEPPVEVERVAVS